jgi:DNA-binding transcriptional ArsR family regulator
MLKTSAFAATAALIGDPARAGMLAALMDGRALTASELANHAGVTPQTASGHLARLTEAGLLAMERQGRHRYHRLASSTIAHMLESIMTVAADRYAANPAPKPRLSVGPRDKAMRRARTCYDHLAGEIAVGMADRMQERGGLELSADGGALTADGADFLRGLGVDLNAAAGRSGRRGGRVFCRPCLDWSERRPHIAGALGAALCQSCFSKGWLRRLEGTRALTVTPLGETALREAFDLRL